jgi:hypothetical protein
MALDRRDLNDTSRAPWVIPALVSAAAIALGIWRLVGPKEPWSDPDVEVVGSASASASAAPRAPPAPRCTEISAEPFVIGDLPPKPAPVEPAASGDPTADPAEGPEDPSAPFAVEIGRGAVFEGGFAAGARRDAEGGAVAMVATVGADGKGGRLVRLGRSRGDLDPPVVAGAGASVLAVLVEPNASGRSLKIAKVTPHAGGAPQTPADVAWGPELSEGRDESLAVDIAASGPRAVVVWDDLSGTGESARSAVMLASFDVATMQRVGGARPITSSSADASVPRLAPRPGGYWLGYLVHGEDDPRKKKKAADSDEAEELGESITTSWLEVVPLDESGTPTGAARAITPRSGHVLSFDLELGDGGSVLAAWRDDDTPTGSGGGKVSAALVRLGGSADPRVLVEEAGSAGAPDLLPGWISLASVSGPTRIAAMAPSGELLDQLAPEPSLGAGEPLAATADAILWARPMVKAMRLSVVRCRPRAAEEAGDAGAAEAGARGGR